MVFSSRSIKMSPRFVLGRENVPCVAEVVNRSLKADCTDFNNLYGYKTFCCNSCNKEKKRPSTVNKHWHAASAWQQATAR